MKISLGNDMRHWNDLFWSFCGKGHEKLQLTQFRRVSRNNSPMLEVFITSEDHLGLKKLIKYQNNVRNVFKDAKLPSENIIGHFDGKYQSL